jgi:hypothetical protein
MTGLRSAVITDHKAGIKVTDEEVGQQTLSRVSKTKINNDIRVQDKMSPNNRVMQEIF